MTRLRLSSSTVINAARFGAKLNRTTNVAAIDRQAYTLSEQQRRGAKDCARSPRARGPGSRPPSARAQELINEQLTPARCTVRRSAPHNQKEGGVFRFGLPAGVGRGHRAPRVTSGARSKATSNQLAVAVESFDRPSFHGPRWYFAVTSGNQWS